MKRTLLIAPVLAMAMAAMGQAPFTPPFSESFEEGLGGFTAYDANNDGNKIKANLNFGGGYNYSKGIYYVGTPDSGADDWLFTPALILKAGMVYELSYMYRIPDSGKTYNVEWKAGTVPETAAMVTSVAAQTEYGYTSGSFEKVTRKITVPSDGDWYLGLHLTGVADQGTFYFDEFKVSEGIGASMPEAPSVSGPSFTVQGDKLTASLDIRLPTNTVGGSSLGTSPVAVNILRSDNETAATVSAIPGATVVYTDVDASTQRVTYTVTCTAGGVEGVAAKADSAPTFGTPKKPGGFKTTQQDNVFTLSWDAVTEATSATALFFPAGVRYTVKCGSTTIADRIDKTTVTHTAEIPEEGQSAFSFSVTALLGNNQSEAYVSPTYLVGKPLEGEFRESFSNYSYDNSGWTVEGDTKNKWMPSAGNSYPAINPQDNDNGCLSFAHDAGKELKLYSPLLDLSSIVNPILKFWVYIQPDAYSEPYIQPGFISGGTEIFIGEPVSLKSGEKEGWTEFSYDIPESALTGNTQLILKGTGAGSYNKIFLDNITILSYLDHNLAISGTPTAYSVEIGEEITIPVTVTNKGVNSESDYTVILYADDNEVSATEGVRLAPGGETVLALPFTALPKYAGKDVFLRATLDMDNDMDATDNVTEFAVAVAINDLAVATGLTAESTQSGVNLSWTAPEVSPDPVTSPVTESFETWENGTTEPLNGWVFIDADGIAQKGLDNFNSNSKFAAMVIGNFSGNYSWDPSVTAYNGEKCLAMTPSYSYGGTTDNWIVSPMIKGGSEIRFFTRTSYSYSATNTFEILWSDGSTEPEGFQNLASKIATNGDWAECVYELPAAAKRFAIHFNGSMSGDALLFDAFSFTAMTEPAVHTGYNIYRNHELIVTLPAGTTAHSDTEATDGVENTYHVTCLYDKGESSYSNAVTGTRGLNTGIDTIEDVTDTKTEFYSLQGVRIAVPAKGDVVIVRKGSGSSRTVIK